MNGFRISYASSLLHVLFLFMLAFINIDAWNGNGVATTMTMSRRRFALRIPTIATNAAIFGSSSVNAASTSSSPSTISHRFEVDVLTSPPITSGSKRTGHENLYFPPWMEGEWDVTQTLISTKAPLGLKFVGGPTGSIDVAQKVMNDQTGRLNEPVTLKLKFISTNLGVVEDRAFNMRSRLDSFAGKSVVASVNYADVQESNRASILAAGGQDSDPLMTTLVYFKGPAAQKTFVISFGTDPSYNDSRSDLWVGYELDRSIFALTNQSIAPPVTTDTEVIYTLKRFGDDRVEGRLRLAGYLNPQSDQLFFEAKNRAVSLNDYTIIFTRSESQIRSE